MFLALAFSSNELAFARLRVSTYESTNSYIDSTEIFGVKTCSGLYFFGLPTYLRLMREVDERMTYEPSKVK